MLCESAIANAQQKNASPKYDSSEATIIQKGFGSLLGKALKETFQSEKKFLRTFFFKNSPLFEVSVLAHVNSSHGRAKIMLFTVMMQPGAGLPMLFYYESCNTMRCTEQI